MLKEEVVRGMLRLAQDITKRKHLEVENLPEGKTVDQYFNELIANATTVPTVDCVTKGYRISIRPLGDSPELCVSTVGDPGFELMCFSYTDSRWINGDYEHTGDFHIREIRINSYTSYKALVAETYAMIDYVESHAN